MFKKTIVQKSVYYDSVKLMLVTREIKAMPGVQEVAVVMGTDLNKETLLRTGLLTEQAQAAAPTDMIVAVSCETEQAIQQIFDGLDGMLNANSAGENKDVYRPKSVETAVKMQPGSNVLTVSVPGRYAKSLAMEGLRNGLHVMLFSDNVTIEEERELKTYAAKKDLLVMGPDCGTAVINGVPLCFANTLRKGGIGLVAASGTGAQEVMTLIHKNGGGLSQVIGTGGRDLRAEIGGITALMAIRALNEDENTQLIAVVSKPPAPQVAQKIITYLREQVTKPVVVNFLGGDYSHLNDERLHFVPTLEQAALTSLELVGAVPAGYSLQTGAEDVVKKQAARVRKSGKYLRGLFSGGTLGYEAIFALQESIGHVSSNMGKEHDLEDCFRMQGHACVDLGDDKYTVGRAHPMIDSSLRAEVLRHELRDPQVAVILLDIVLGYGSNKTPEKELVEELARYRAEHPQEYVCVVASLCGSKDDPQDYERIENDLREQGVLLMPSNLQATRLAARILQAVEYRR